MATRRGARARALGDGGMLGVEGRRVARLAPGPTVGGAGRPGDRGPTVSTATRHPDDRARPGRHPVRRRLRRRHAADGRPSSPRSARRFGNDPATLPDFPAEIRAPAGHPGRACRPSRSTSPTTTSSPPATPPSVLVAMNPAALKANVRRRAPRRHASSSTSTPSTSAPSTRPATPPTRSPTAPWPPTRSTRSR